MNITKCNAPAKGESPRSIVINRVVLSIKEVLSARALPHRRREEYHAYAP